MNSVAAWYLGLSKVSKALVLGGASMGGLMTASALTVPPHDPVTDPVMSAEVSEEVEKPDSVITTETQVEKQKLPFNTVTREDSSLPSGQTRVESHGSEGEKTITHLISLTNGIETDRKTSEQITKRPVDQVIAVGTYVQPAPRCDSNYVGGCVPMVGYDLNCPDIGFMVQVVGVDIHRFDRDRDGWGCESYS